MGNRLDEEMADYETMESCDAESGMKMPSKYLNDFRWVNSYVENDFKSEDCAPCNISARKPTNDCEYWGPSMVDNDDYEEMNDELFNGEVEDCKDD